MLLGEEKGEERLHDLLPPLSPLSFKLQKQVTKTLPSCESDN